MILLLLSSCLILGIGCSQRTEEARRAIPEVDFGSLDASLVGQIKGARETVQKQPQSSENWGRLGQAFEAGEFFRAASACYRTASEVEPANGKWLYLLSLLEMQQQPEEALAHLSRAVELIPPTNEAPRLRLAQALAERGKFAEAAPHLEKLLAMHPTHPAARLELARAKMAANDLDGAEVSVQPSLTNAYTARAAHHVLSQVKQRSGDSAGAASLARRAASMPRPFAWPDPYLREVSALRVNKADLLDRVNALMMRQRLVEAEEILSEILARTPEDTEALLLMGRLRLQQRRCAEAEEVLLRHIGLRTNSLQGFVQLGLARYCESRWADSAEAFRSALQLKPDFAQTHYNLGLALSRANDGEGAIKSFQAALRCQPGDANAHGALAEELLRSGRASDALREAEMALRIDPAQPRAGRVRQALLDRK